MPDIVGKIIALHRSLDTAGLPHAFGGALALAWCTEQARGTIDIDLNVFVTTDRATEVLAALPSEVTATEQHRMLLGRDGQVRVRWETTPVDLFLDTTAFHSRVSTRCRWEPLDEVMLPFLSCSDLAVFKAFFDRTKDWADLEAMIAVGSLDVEGVLGVLVRYLGGEDPRVTRLASLVPGD